MTTHEEAIINIETYLTAHGLQNSPSWLYIQNVLNQAKQLEQDVNELLGIINHLEHLQVADDYVPDINWERYGELRNKLLKVGKSE